MALALFDLDETLIAGDSDYEWGAHLVSLGKVDQEYYAKENERFYQEYLSGTLDVNEFLKFSLQPLTKYPYQELCQWREAYIEQRIKPIIKPKAPRIIDFPAPVSPVIILSLSWKSSLTLSIIA